MQAEISETIPVLTEELLIGQESFGNEATHASADKYDWGLASLFVPRYQTCQRLDSSDSQRRVGLTDSLPKSWERSKHGLCLT